MADDSPTQCDPILQDSKDNCSICLEPYTGRQPKLLPCFHTFCLPCLTELAQVFSSRTGEGNNCGWITCPACRKVVSVPPGGVEHFQSNFYISGGDDDDDSAVVTNTNTPRCVVQCALCDGTDDVHHSCERCGHFCHRCHTIHSRLCPSANTTSNTVINNTTAAPPRGPPYSSSMKEEEEKSILEAGARLLQDTLRQVHLQRQELEVQIHARYAEGIRLLTQARDVCVGSLDDAEKTATKVMQGEMERAQKELMNLDFVVKGDMQSSSLPSSSYQDYGKTQTHASSLPPPSSSLQSRVGMMKEGDHDVIEHFRGFLNNASQWSLAYEYEPQPAPMAPTATGAQGNCFQQFMGTVRLKERGNEIRDNNTSRLKREQDVIYDTNSSGSLAMGGGEASLGTSAMTSQLVNVLVQRVETMASQLAMLEQKTSGFQREVASLRMDHDQRHSSATTCQERLTHDVASCLQGLQSMRDKNALLCQDLAVLHDLKVKVGELEVKVQGHEESSAVVDGHSSTSRDVQSLRDAVSTHEVALAEIGACLEKYRTQVAFHVLLHADQRVRTERVLIMKNQVVNTGQAYSTDTGYFTAPVAGVYLFLATACSADTGKPASLDLVHEGRDLAYLGTSTESSTCHVAARVGLGERVWLRTVKPKDDAEGGGGCRYLAAGWLTSFSGVLVHPDL